MASSPLFKVRQFIVNPCEECTYVVHDATGEAVIIDCGTYYDSERRRLLKYLDDEALRPVRLLLTHAHHDHIYGNDIIHDRYGLLPEVHINDKPLMTSHIFKRIAEIYRKYPHEIPLPKRYLVDGEEICFGEHKLSVIHTPGHTPGSVFFYCESEGVAFSGDTLFKRDIGTTRLMFSSEEDIYASLDRIIQLLPDETVIYPGHGGKTTIGYEKLHNPFLKAI